MDRKCAECDQPCDRRALRCLACSRKRGAFTSKRAADAATKRHEQDRADRALAAKARELGITAD